MNIKPNDPVIVSAVRTPIGDFGGSLRSVSHEGLAVTVLKAVCDRVNFAKEQVDEVYWGVVMVRSDENGLARGAVLKAGFPAGERSRTSWWTRMSILVRRQVWRT